MFVYVGVRVAYLALVLAGSGVTEYGVVAEQQRKKKEEDRRSWGINYGRMAY